MPQNIVKTGKTPLTLSPFQKIWLTDDLGNNGLIQATFTTFLFDGSLNIELINRVLNEIWQRHETLHTILQNDNNQISLWLATDAYPRLSFVNLEHLTPYEQDIALKQHISEAASLQFNLTEKAVQVKLIRLDKNHHLLLLTAHPLACDATSTRLFGIEFMQLYEAFTKGESPSIAKPIFQYQDFVESYQLWLEEESGRSDITYWQTELSRQVGHCRNFGDQALSSYHGITVNTMKVIISAPLSTNLQSLATVYNVDLEIMLLAIFQMLLHRYIGDDEFGVGVTVSGHKQQKRSELIGCFVNYIVLGAKFRSGLTFVELLNQINLSLKYAEEHSKLSLQTVLEKCLETNDTDGCEATAKHNDLFRVIFSRQKNPLLTGNFSDLVLTQLNLDEPILVSDLALSVFYEKDDIALKFLYNSEIFSSEFASYLLKHFINAVKAVLEQPHLPIEQLSLIDGNERQQVTVEWNNTNMEFHQDCCLHELFADQVKRSPNNCAVIHHDQKLSYQELDERANRLARYLQQFDIKPDTKVAIYLEPSIELLVAIFAVFKAGAAYTPIALSTPQERVGFLLSDTCAAIMISKERFIQSEADFPCQLILLDRDTDNINNQEATAPINQVTPENLAYVIYTSGSTGEPKGVMVAHRGIVNTLLWRQQTFPFTETDRVLLTFSFVFDASLFQLFQPLLSGACLVIPETEHGGDPIRIIRFIRCYGITIFGITPSMLALLLKEPDFEQCNSVKTVFCGGESLSEELIDKINQRGGITLHNMYGPTETSMEATYWTATPKMRVAIGRPIVNVQVYILDQQLQPTGVGMPGELYIGGAGVARGYLNKPALTAERFLPDPFSSLTGKRMYRTGDMCRWLPNGCVEYLGRQDQQIKLHGHRLELEEIEISLQKSKMVRENAVVLQEDQFGEKRLVSYIVPSKIGKTNPDDLRRYLRNQLPTYMIPSTFVFLESLPRTFSGKVDRQVLRVPKSTSGSRPISDLSGKPLEHFLLRLWQEVLGISEIGENDNFFELGGNSLLAAVLTHKIEDNLQEFVYTVALYDAPTIEKLAHYLRLNYPQSIVRLFGSDALNGLAPLSSSAIDNTSISSLMSIIRTIPERRDVPSSPKNPPAVFILSPPRSGSTLLRVMLGGHPDLFAPPELQLLNYNTLGERKVMLSSERDNFWLQGTIRALMQIHDCSFEEAAEIMKDFEQQDLSVKQFYRLMQESLGEVMLVDKTPTYALDLQTLNRAEQDFENALYIHLIRHPSPMIASFEEAKLHVFFPPFLTKEHDFTVLQLAELIWYISHQNIREFLSNIPNERQQTVHFEDLVSNPKQTMEKVVQFLGLPFHPQMINPYKQDQKTQMTDAVHSMARMLGDVKFHQHGQIKAEAADRHYGRYPEQSLGEVTRQRARQLGYELHHRSSKILVHLETGGQATPLFCVHPTGGDVSCYHELVRQLGENQPFYAFRSEILNRPQIMPKSVQELAFLYLQELQNVQPQGPYQLGGWSFGGLIALEMALQLSARGEEIALLALFSTYINKNAALLLPPRLGEFLRGFCYEYGLDIQTIKTRNLNKMQLLRYTFMQAKKAGVISQDLVFPEFCRVIEQQWHVYRMHLKIGRCYVPQERVKHLVLIEATDQSLDGYGPFEDWKTYAHQVSSHRVPGNHFTMLHEPNVRHLAELLRQYL